MFEDDDDDEIPEEFAAALARVAAELVELGDADAIAHRFARYKDDPEAFFAEKLGVQPWTHPEETDQADVIRAVQQSDRVVVKSGHKTGKSLTAAGLALWWVATRNNARAVITAPAFHQVKNIIWKEIRARFRDRPLADELGAEPALDPGTGLQMPNGNEIVGISTKTAENLAGLSSPNLFFLIDEGTGFPDFLFEVVMGNAAGGAKIFAISNPTRTSGWFFKLFRTKAKAWTLLTLSSESTPNFVSGEKLVPGLANRAEIEEFREYCGPNYRDDPFYMVRALGEFPGQGVDSVISATAIDRAVARRAKADRPAASEGELTLGVDCARLGNDDNIIAPVRGTYCHDLVTVDVAAARDNPRLVVGQMVAEAVVSVALGLRIGLERVRVNIDGIGVGAGVVDFLKVCKPVLDGWMYIVDMNVGENADEVPVHDGTEKRPNYRNLRSQLWFGIADWLRTGALPDDESLHAELLAATYTFDKRGRYEVEPKIKMRAALGRSPDKADAVGLAVYRGMRGSWTSYAYDAVPDPRHAGARRGDDDEDDDDGGGGRGGSFSFL